MVYFLCVVRRFPTRFFPFFKKGLMATLCRTPSRGAVEYAWNTAVISHSLVRWNAYMVGLFLFRGYLGPGCNCHDVTTTDVRGVVEFTPRSSPALIIQRETTQPRLWVPFTSPDCARPVTPQRNDYSGLDLCCTDPGQHLTTAGYQAGYTVNYVHRDLFDVSNHPSRRAASVESKDATRVAGERGLALRLTASLNK